MRLVLSLVGILVAVVIVLLMARGQLSATRGVVERTTTITAPTGAGADKSAPAPTSAPQASQQAQRNVANQINEALQQGAASRAAAADK